MIIEFAPMEGITGYVFRRAHVALFSGVAEYYLPFIATHATRTLKTKEREDVSPACNAGLSAVPQLLSKNADDFLWYAEELRNMGYRKVNLNLGCPSPTVTAKGKGAALLGDPEALKRFLDAVFSREPDIKISVKTRLGIEDPREIYELLHIYNSFPLDELIVHGRTLAEAYRGGGHPELLPEILGLCKCPLSYNGNIFFPEDAERLKELCPGLDRIMIGRGLVRNPALAREILGASQGKQNTDEPVSAKNAAGGLTDAAGSLICRKENSGDLSLTNAALERFLDEVYQGYRKTLPGPVPVLGRMKELWYYTEDLFETPEPGTEAFRALRSLKKARAFPAYEAAQAAFFAFPPPRKTGRTRWQVSGHTVTRNEGVLQ